MFNICLLKEKKWKSLEKSNTLIKKYQVIILAANWKKWSADLINDTVDRLELSNNQKIYVVGPKMFGKININKYIGTTLEVRLKLFNNLKKHIKDVNNLLKSKSKNTAVENRKVQGKVLMTFLNGELAFKCQ